MNISPSRSSPARLSLKERHLLTPPPSTKTTFHIRLRSHDLQFKVGDSLAIFAKNDPHLVRHLIEAIHARGDEMIIDPRSQQEMPLEQFLSTKANLARLTSSFLKFFHAHDREQKKLLDHLLQPENRAQLSAYLAEHDPLDLCKASPHTELPLQEFCSQFSPLLPRFYSIASSPLAEPDAIDLTVALFTFTHAGAPRFGVASHFLCYLADPDSTPIPAYVQASPHFTLPEDENTPIIMIGPGTGIAPFRAFLQERMAKGSTGKNWLFFGERNRATDFFYADELNAWTASRHLRLDVAFSRDQSEKLYVQHKMQENSKDLWAWLQEGAYFYVCGDAERMAKDVEATLISIAQQEGNLTLDAASDYVRRLRIEKRYLADVY